MPLNNPITSALLADPEIFQQNRLPFHAHFADQTSPEMPLTVSLDGEWNFRYAENLTAPFTDWDTMTVPGFIQMQSLQKPGRPYGTPHYVNTQYPWDGHEKLHPGEIPQDYNPIGEYQRSFTLPESWASCYLRLNGADSAAAVWCNGVYIGYTEDTFTPAEFDMTAAVHPGENTLTVQVYRFSSGSWLEDQDFWRMSGLFRSVELFTKPELHLEDAFVKQEFAPDFSSATVTFDCKVSGAGTVSVVFNGQEQSAEVGEPAEYDSGVVFGKGEVAPDVEEDVQDVSFTFTVEHPALWSAEQPNLYEAEIALLREGDLAERTSLKVGLRKFELKDHQMLLNGQRIVFKGANRHEFSSITGRAVGVHTHEELLQDIITMKQNNINAIRTSHYQNQDALYDLCDEYGLYLIAENNLESHGTWDIHQAGIRGIEGVLPNDKPEWKAVLFDRMNSTYQRDKNHPAVLIWSLGNESFGGETLLQMAEMVRRFDDTRLVHYEGVVNDPRFLETTDIESHMYSTVKDIKEYLAQGDKRPYIECEYSHAMGNSNGALHKYTELADQKDCGYQGGFIWDYIDQSIWKKDRYGKWFQAYGGDFGERPTDYNFSGNGIAYGGDRAPSPKMQEVKFCYQNIAISIDNSGFEVWNKNLFTSTGAFDCVALLHRDGKLYQQQELTNIDVAPEERSSFPLPFMVPALPGEYAVTISFRLKEDTSWAKKGHEVAFGQGVIAVVRSIPSKKVTPFTVTHGTHNIGVRGENFDVLFSDLNGGLTSYRYAGKEMIQEIPRPNFWRAPTDNDCGNNMGGVRGQWKLASLYATAKGIGKEIPSVHGGTILQNPTCEVEADSVVVTYLYNLQTSPAAECSLQYRVFGDGRIQTTLHYDPVEGLAAMPEFGVLFKIDADYDTVEWYGNGPAETYWDRQHGAKLGIYQNKVADNMAQYLVPQECGAKTAVRWAKVVDRKGRGLLFTADAAKPMFFSALPYTPHEMESAKHPYELPPVHYTVIRAMGEQMGVGGDDSWGANVHPEYIPDVTKPVEFTFTFRGI